MPGTVLRKTEHLGKARTTSDSPASMHPSESSRSVRLNTRIQRRWCCSATSSLTDTSGTAIDRLVGVVFVDDADAGLDQVRAGMAWHYLTYCNESSRLKIVA